VWITYGKGGERSRKDQPKKEKKMNGGQDFRLAFHTSSHLYGSSADKKVLG
jgi:hypothetical protein